MTTRKRTRGGPQWTSVPVRYSPRTLSPADKVRQARMLIQSRKHYRQHRYTTRKPVRSYTNRVSKHIRRAQTQYGLSSIRPSRALSRATGCSLSALRKIVRKGEGAYFSSGSRPNQTAQSWGIARLASSLTAGKSAAVDFAILEKGCDHRKTAFRLAKQSRKKHGYGQSPTRKIKIRI